MPRTPRIIAEIWSAETPCAWRGVLRYAPWLLLADLSLVACGATSDGVNGDPAAENAGTPGQGATQGTGEIREEIWKGVDTTDKTILRIETVKGFCSSVVITTNHLLTSAHCLETNSDMCGSYKCHKNVAINVYRSEGDGLVSLFGTARNAITYRDSQYTESDGVPITQHDLAVIEFPDINWSFGTANTRPIWASLPKVGEVLEAYGWGTIDASHDVGGVLKAPPGDGVFDIDWVDSGNSYFYDDDDGDVNLCIGDSGGPALKNTGSGRRKVVGLFSNFQFPSGKLCRVDSGDKERWTRVADKIGWLENRLMNSVIWACPSSGPFCCTHDGSEIRCY